MATTVRIVIKNPSQSPAIPDFRLEFALAATIAQLKQHLAANYPNNPSPIAQKLIFAGRLLQDDQTVADVLRQHDITLPQTFHLVVRAPQPGDRSTTSPVVQPQPHQGAAGGAFGVAMAAGAAGAGRGFYGIQQQYQPQPYFGAGAAAAYQPQPQPQPQGYYGQQQHIPAPANPYQHPYHYHQQYHHQQQQQQHVNQQQQQQQQQQQGPYQGQQQPHQQMFNLPPPRVGGGAAAGGGLQLALVAKLAFMVLLMSQGASTDRVVWLSIAALLIYLYQAGRIQVHRVFVPPNIPAPAPAPVPAPAAPAPAEAPAGGEPVNNNVAAIGGAVAGVGAGAGAGAGGMLGELRNAVIPFFYSLLPTYDATGAPAPQLPADPDLNLNNVH